MRSEEEFMDEIFGTPWLWRGRKFIWCETCGTYSVIFDCCQNSSCNGGGCEKCHEESVEFSKGKVYISDYLSEKEIETLYKIERVKKFIKESLIAGFTEINWENIHENGSWCQKDLDFFPELREPEDKNSRY